MFWLCFGWICCQSPGCIRSGRDRLHLSRAVRSRLPQVLTGSRKHLPQSMTLSLLNGFESMYARIYVSVDLRFWHHHFDTLLGAISWSIYPSHRIFVEVHQASDYNYCIWYLVCCAGYLDPLQNFTARHPDWIAHDLARVRYKTKPQRDCFSPSKEASFVMVFVHVF